MSIFQNYTQAITVSGADLVVGEIELGILIGDVNYNGKIGLEEAINALHILSGVIPTTIDLSGIWDLRGENTGGDCREGVTPPSFEGILIIQQNGTTISTFSSEVGEGFEGSISTDGFTLSGVGILGIVNSLVQGKRGCPSTLVTIFPKPRALTRIWHYQS